MFNSTNKFTHKDNITNNIELKSSIKLNDVKNLDNIQSYRDNIEHILKVEFVNNLNIEPNYCNIDCHWSKKLKYCVPRPCKDEIVLDRPRTPWSFPISIWAKQYNYNYSGESEVLYKKAFEHDFNRCNFNKDTKSNTENLNKLKDLLWIFYKDLLNVYKHFSSGVTPIWQIGNSSILDLIHKSNNFIEPSYTQNFMLLKLQGVKSVDSEETKKKNKNVPDGVIRHQLMNFLVKISIDKYIMYLKQFKDPIEAIDYSFKNHFENNLFKLFSNSHDWRIKRYYNEKVDNFIQAHLPLLFAFFKTYSNKIKLAGKRDNSYYMEIESFHSLCNSLVGTDCPIKEVDLYFNLSISLQENEVDFEKHYYLNFPEFLEALCRVVDRALTEVSIKYNTNSIANNNKNISDKEDNTSMLDISEDDKSIKNNEPKDSLVLKLDVIKNKFQKLIASTQEFKQVKEKFVFPLKTQDGLYEFDKNSQFYKDILFPEKDSFNSLKRSTKINNNLFFDGSLFKSNIKFLDSSNAVMDEYKLKPIEE